MAIATLTSTLTDVSLDPGAPISIGSGNAQQAETVINLQGLDCAATGHAGGLGPTAPTSINQFRGMYVTIASLPRANTHLHMWVRDLYPVRNKNVGGVSVYLFGVSECLYYATGLDDGYAGGWVHLVIDLDTVTRAPVDLGVLPSSNITRVGYCGNISATKGEAFLQNCYLDAIRAGTAGQGVRFTGGLSNDRLTLLDCANADTNSYGLLRSSAGVLFCEGPLEFGNLNTTLYLTDSLVTMSFVGFTNGAGTPMVADTYYSIKLNNGNAAACEVVFNDVTFNGVSRAMPFTFDSSAMNLNSSYISTRSTYIFGKTIIYGVKTTSINDNFVECVNIIPNGIILTNPKFTNCDKLTLTSVGDSLSGGSTVNHNTLPLVAFVVTNSLNKISGHIFSANGSAGHAIEINTAGSYTLSGCTFSGYGANASNGSAIVNTSNGLVTINIVNGNTPTIRNTGTSTTIVNNAVLLEVSGMTQGAACVVLADENKGTILRGDVLLQGFADQNGKVADTGFNYQGAFDPVGLAVTVSARDSGICNAANALDGTITTDETINANSSNPNDMTLLPNVPSIGDSYFFSHNRPFSGLKIEVSTAGQGGYVLEWHYLSGTGWLPIVNLQDSTNNLKILGENKIIWDVQPDWAKVGLGSVGSFYHVRMRYASGTVSTPPRGRKCTLDATRYLPFNQKRIITSQGLTVVASWVEDKIATF